MDAPVGFFSRLGLAVALFFKVLADGVLAGRVQRALGPPAAAPQPGREPKADGQAHAHHAASLAVLAALQREGRLLDFLEEDVASFTDEQVGAAARVVHEGCRRMVRQYLTVAPLRSEAEGDAITVEAGFDPRRVRLTGNVVGQPPFKGVLKHRGWQARDVRWPAPPKGADATVLMPAEVEL